MIKASDHLRVQEAYAWEVYVQQGTKAVQKFKDYAI